MHRHVVFTDTALDQIERSVAAHPPERGGALLGPLGEPIVSEFVYDDLAETGSTFYEASRQLNDRVRATEASNPALELKGILHSHPSSLSRPSQGDLVAFADSLRRTPWLGRFIVPIVTSGTAHDDHEFALPSGRLSCFVVEMHGDLPHVEPAQIHRLPIDQHTAQLATDLGARHGEPVVVNLDGQRMLANSVTFKEGGSLQILFPSIYPFAAPTILLSGTPDQFPTSLECFAGADAQTVRALPIQWDLAVPEASRLRAAIPAPAVPEVNALAETVTANDGLSDRLEGIIDDQIADRKVLLVGAGSGGSHTAELLVRSGVKNLTIIDHDVVEPANLSRSVYRLEHIGSPKVEALTRHLRSIVPSTTISGRASRLQDVPRAELQELFETSDVVVAATDDPAAQQSINHLAYHFGVPAVFSGVYARGAAGDIAFTVPGITKCYRCTIAATDQGHERELNYGTGRLQAEPALAVDIQLVVIASVKVVLSLLHLDSDKAPIRDFVLGALQRDLNLCVVSATPDYGWFPSIFETVPGQYAYQSAWLSAEGREDCHVCGEVRVDPTAVSLGGSPRLGELEVEPLTSSDASKVPSSNQDQAIGDAGIRAKSSSPLEDVDRPRAALGPTQPNSDKSSTEEAHGDAQAIRDETALTEPTAENTNETTMGGRGWPLM